MPGENAWEDGSASTYSSELQEEDSNQTNAITSNSDHFGMKTLSMKELEGAIRENTRVAIRATIKEKAAERAENNRGLSDDEIAFITQVLEEEMND